MSSTEGPTAEASSTDELAVLHTLRVRGLADSTSLAESTGLPVEGATAAAERACADGFARARSGRVQGYMLTSTGRGRHESLLAESTSSAERAALEPAYQAFLSPNRRFKQVTTTWQTKAAGDIGVVLAELDEIHQEVSAVLHQASAAIPRFGSYPGRLDAALSAFRAGDGNALAQPMTGSYHDVWMELHEDLLVTLGRERTDDDE